MLSPSERKELLPFSGKESSGQKRVLQQSRRHDRTTDIEDTKEVNSTCFFSHFPLYYAQLKRDNLEFVQIVIFSLKLCCIQFLKDMMEIINFVCDWSLERFLFYFVSSYIFCVLNYNWIGKQSEGRWKCGD